MATAAEGAAAAIARDRASQAERDRERDRVEQRAREERDKELASDNARRAKAAELDRRGKWECRFCTLENDAAARVCAVCTKLRADAPQAAPPAPAPAGAWQCGACTFAENAPGIAACAVCGAAKGAARAPVVAAQQQRQQPKQVQQQVQQQQQQKRAPVQAPQGGWTCGSCTYAENAAGQVNCAICSVPRGGAKWAGPMGGGGSGGGGVPNFVHPIQQPLPARGGGHWAVVLQRLW